MVCLSYCWKIVKLFHFHPSSPTPPYSSLSSFGLLPTKEVKRLEFRCMSWQPFLKFLVVDFSHNQSNLSINLWTEENYKMRIMAHWRRISFKFRVWPWVSLGPSWTDAFENLLETFWFLWWFFLCLSIWGQLSSFILTTDVIFFCI